MVDLQRSKTVFLAGLTTVALTMAEPAVDASAAASSEGAIIRLDLLPGGTTSRATAVNDRGVIVGYGDTANGENHAIRWNRRGRVTDLGTLPGGAHSYAYGINDHGDTVGYADNADGSERAVRWAPNGAITDLGTLPGRTASYAFGINDEGSVVGEVPIRPKIYHAVKWQPDGTIIDLGTTSPRGSTAADAINDDGVVIGRTFTVGTGNFVNAGTWPAGATTVTLLPPLPDGGPRSNSGGINDKGLIVGYAQSRPGPPPIYAIHATLWSPGASAPTDLGVLPGGSDYSVANGINNAGTIVGISATSTPEDRGAVLWKRRKGGWHIVPLPQLPGGRYSEATAINNAGEVVGEASTASDQSIAVRWK
ncbi:hypothetical protein [Actinomadura litoris]|uniref:Uncharacterized protein n=1 Tax=Actinomadura litoris TaxID=2678616 RepID=A0A7K1L4J9_9ACTN|nr:hypothetical protein [Actinomadura litoris]MUN39358.1 hypothetical protein [Actinomadura litoris]